MNLFYTCKRVFITIYELFWSPKFWLPQNIKWEDIRKNRDIGYPHYDYFCIYVCLIATSLLVTKYLLIRFLFTRLALLLEIKVKKLKKPVKNILLEKAYHLKSNWNYKETVQFAKQLNWSERRVQKWLHLKRVQEKPTLLTKFCEHCWLSFFYFNAVIYGLITAWDKHWFWNISYCWIDYPHHTVTDDIWLYYATLLAFYLSSILMLVWSVKKSDYYEMVIHHFIAIGLLLFSWVCNYHRIGITIMILHNSSDFILEAVKAAKYAKYYILANQLFIIFFVMWAVTRLYIFPTRILHSVLFVSASLMDQHCLSYYLFSYLLCCLFIMHLYSTYSIINMAFQMFIVWKIKRDLRSSESSEFETPKKYSRWKIFQPTSFKNMHVSSQSS